MSDYAPTSRPETADKDTAPATPLSPALLAAVVQARYILDVRHR